MKIPITVLVSYKLHNTVNYSTNLHYGNDTCNQQRVSSEYVAVVRRLHNTL